MKNHPVIKRAVQELEYSSAPIFVGGSVYSEGVIIEVISFLLRECLELIPFKGLHKL